MKQVFAVALMVLNFSIFASAESLKIHAIHKETFSCTEHWTGQFKYTGDALGTDCVINGWYEDETRLFPVKFRGDGLKNEDWYGFEKEVLAPCDCIVVKVHINGVTNQPGIMNPGRASSITFKDDSYNYVLLAHVRNVSVKEGDKVTRGKVVAKVGNNGYSRNPHIHIGAWDKDGKPLQIQFDQTTLALLDREAS